MAPSSSTLITAKTPRPAGSRRGRSTQCAGAR
jgi:hypothetical protein